MSEKHGFCGSGMFGAAVLLVFGSAGCWSHSAVGFHARTLNADIDSDVTRARAVYCAERAREHRSVATAYTTTRNVLFGVALAGVGTAGAALAADKAADGELGNDTLSALAVTGLVGAAVALVGGLVADSAVSSHEEGARTALRGGAAILALHEQRRATEAQQKDEEEAAGEDEDELPAGAAQEIKDMFTNLQTAKAKVDELVTAEAAAKQTLKDAAYPVSPAVERARTDFRYARMKTAAARESLRDAQLKFRAAVTKSAPSQSAEQSASDAEGELSSEELAFRECLGGERSTEVVHEEPSPPPEESEPVAPAKAEGAAASGKGGKK